MVAMTKMVFSRTCVDTKKNIKYSMKPNVYKYSKLKCLTAEIRLPVLNWIYSAVHRANNIAQTKFVYVLNA